jgi:hypothetical protein
MEPLAKDSAAEGMDNLQDLSVTGGIINAYNALKLASAMKGDRVLINNKTTPAKKVVKKTSK